MRTIAGRALANEADVRPPYEPSVILACWPIVLSMASEPRSYNLLLSSGKTFKVLSRLTWTTGIPSVAKYVRRKHALENELNNIVIMDDTFSVFFHFDDSSNPDGNVHFLVAASCPLAQNYEMSVRELFLYAVGIV